MNLKENASFIVLGVLLTSLFFLGGCTTNNPNPGDFSEENSLQNSIYNNPKDVNLEYTLDGKRWTLTT